MTRDRRKWLSADLPQYWLHDPTYWSLSDAAWRLHCHALMWAIGRTDGHIPGDMLPALLTEDAEKAAMVLVDAGLWQRTATGWQVRDWRSSQSTVAQIETNRRQTQKRVAKWRAEQA